MRKISYKTYLDKVYGCFVGKAISGNIGAPHEGVKMPMEFEFMPEMINCELPNDDLDLQVAWLDVLEKYGENFTSYHLLEKFVSCCDYSPGEYSIMRKNFMRGIYPPYSGKFCNDFYIEGMGCPIRSEIWGCVAVGNMRLAQEFAILDGQMDHNGESIWAERFMAALESEAFFESDVKSLITGALNVLPENSKFRSLVEYTIKLCEKYNDIHVVLTKLLFRYGHPDCTNMYQNMGIVIASLLMGDGDIIKTSLMALNCGFDTDCTCATAGAVIGLLRGADDLIKSYGLTEVTYTLGVDIKRRSNRIYDLAEDIAKMGVHFARVINREVYIEYAPEDKYDFGEKPCITFEAQYEDMKPYVELGKSRKVNLVLKNSGEEDMKLHCKLTPCNGLVCDKNEFDITVKGGAFSECIVEFLLPIDTEFVYEKNIISFIASDADGSRVLDTSFGIVGATPWKLCGPFWRTEPVCNTELLLEHFSDNHPYEALLSKSAVCGNFTDKLRHFHLNFAADTKTEFLTEDELFSTLDDSAVNSKYEQTLISQPEDSFLMKDFYGFQGPCTAYMSRILVAPEDMEVYIQIGHSSPFTLYINGDVIARRDNCDTFTAENVHIGPVKLNRGENCIVMRITRVNADCKYNIIFSKGLTMEEHYVCFASKNPYNF